MTADIDGQRCGGLPLRHSPLIPEVAGTEPLHARVRQHPSRHRFLCSRAGDNVRLISTRPALIGNSVTADSTGASS